MDPLSMVEDEVALEGLDGITIPSLWIRLEDRKPKFLLKLDDGTKELIWKSLVGNSDLTFYLLPTEREDVVLYDRFQHSQETVMLQDKKDVYPLHILHENKDGIQGSCAFFHERKDVTSRLRSRSLGPLVSLDDTFKKHGRKLVIVASQMLRFRALIGSESDPDTKLTDESYCMLERVGRGRWQGELQNELQKSCFKVDSRKLHYIRKSLDRHGLVCTQACTTLLKSGQRQHSIHVMLKRFHVIRRSKYDLLMEYVSELLQKMPGRLAALVTIRDHFNLPEITCKRVFQYMRAAKLVDYCSMPLEDLDNEGGAVVNSRGNKVMVRCVKLLKSYAGGKHASVEDENEDEDDEEDESSASKRRGWPPVGRIMENDLMLQAYRLILSSGADGIPQSGISSRMNIGNLEARMLWRKMERDGVIKGFMVDEGRQRITKFISHRCVGASDHLQLFAKEKQRKNLYDSSASAMSASTPSASPLTPATSKQSAKRGRKAPASKKSRVTTSVGGEEDEVAGELCFDGGANGGKVCRKPKGGGKAAEKKGKTKPAEKDAPAQKQRPTENDEEEASSPQSQEKKATDPAVDIAVVDIYKLPVSKSIRSSHETYRLLRRKNLITEAVHKLQVIEGLTQLQKLINNEEKGQGVTTKCCKKTTARLVQNLSREGLLKMFTTTVIQDGISKKVDLIVHPTIQPSDKLVTTILDQVRFRISSSCTMTGQQPSQEPASKVEKEEPSKSFRSFSEIKEEHLKEKSRVEPQFKPTTVRGLGKTLGFQPKMHRLRVFHAFLWYVICDHPMMQTASGPTAAPQEAPEAGHQENAQSGTDKDQESKNTELPDDVGSSPPEPATSHVDFAPLGDEELMDDSTVGQSESEAKVYLDEDSWKRFVPPVLPHRERGYGWVRMRDLLFCLPLSIFIQVIQINYQVDGLEDYLNDPVKQHLLIRQLPMEMRRKLFYKRKYIWVVFENLQKLVCMGLVHFAPVVKAKEKAQMSFYLKHHATIVDTSNAEPHYWLVTEPSDKPFERRRYTFVTVEDVESYWFDLMCVCLNTPLGLIRPKRGGSEDEVTPSFVHERNVFVGMASLLKGSNEVCDDGTTPGDGKGAGGLDSEFFAHLKRNWLWTNSLIPVNEKSKLRLRSLLNKDSLRAALRDGTLRPHYLTPKKPLVTEENVEVAIESSSRNQQVVGGKRQRRKRTKKEVIRVPRKKKKEPKKRTRAHDEADHRALKMMTRQRVNWTVPEDSLLMLCNVASHVLNSKLRRTFVAHCVVRDLLQVEFEISEDKTSLAVGRRSRYILKNPQAFLNFRICLAEVYQDEHLMKLLQDNKPADPNNVEDCTKSFTEYVKLLRQKLRPVPNAEAVKMPDSKHQLFSQFKVSAIHTRKEVPCKDTLSNTTDIHTIGLHNLIQSTLAMTNYQMKYSRSFQTFHVYSKYQQDLLCQVFIQCRMRSLVNRRRVCHKIGPQKNRAVPILPMSYQLSQSYYRLFSWRFPHSLCTDSFRFMRTLLNNDAGDKPLVSFHLETECRTVSGEEALEGTPASDEKETQKQAEKRDASRGECDQMNSDKTFSRYLSEMLCFSLDSPGGACVVSLTLMSLGLLSVHLSIPKQMVVVDSNMVDPDIKSMVSLEEEEDDNEDGEECAGKKRMEVKAHQASHTKYLLMKGYFVPGIVKLRNLNTNDNIVVESCLIGMQLRNTPAHSILTDDSEPPLDFSKCGPSLLPSILSHSFRPAVASSSVTQCDAGLVQQRGYTPQDLAACAELRRSLGEAGEKGVDQQDLFKIYTHLYRPQSGRSRSLQQYLEDLEEEDQVLKVGSCGARWVLMKHAEPWILTVSSRNWSAPILDRPSRHNIPFLRKRRRHQNPQQHGEDKDEPPGKKAAVGCGEGHRGEDGAGWTSEKLGQEDKLEGEQEEVLTGEEKSEQEDEAAKLAGNKSVEKCEEKCEPGEDKMEEDKNDEAVSTQQANLHKENISFVSRPWRLVDGTVNRQVCKGMLEGILFHIMSFPGITQQTLVEYYQGVLQPVVLMELVQSLIELGCLTKKTVDKKPKATLFSRPVPAARREVEPMTVERDCVFYEPTIGCCLRLAQVLPNERHWNHFK
ncbi:general transcription factor 3C polypeptide 1-like [Dunckerocampus dactyliophorus]|uniref:general transcription factor 3C polypeptide 1-like n=1 Tax=Dunckerocampus dactyliophorus TaxID=161453 RepID=UPI002404D8AF|nr:general transcription factor 3C polypeptide 1-like [Dunckerocampus dactyliophorus]